MARPATKEHFRDWNMGSKCLISCHTCRLPHNMAVQNLWSCLWEAWQTIFTWSSTFEISKEKPPPPPHYPFLTTVAKGWSLMIILNILRKFISIGHLMNFNDLKHPPPCPFPLQRSQERILENAFQRFESILLKFNISWILMTSTPPPHCSQGRILKDPYQHFGEILLKFIISWIPMSSTPPLAREDPQGSFSTFWGNSSQIHHLMNSNDKIPKYHKNTLKPPKTPKNAPKTLLIPPKCHKNTLKPHQTPLKPPKTPKTPLKPPQTAFNFLKPIKTTHKNTKNPLNPPNLWIPSNTPKTPIRTFTF